jgi:hypothetical protein
MEKNNKIILFLIGIFLLSIALRIHMFEYNHFFEFDQYFHARITWDIVTQGHVNNPDILAYYSEGGAPQTFTSLYWIITAALYNIFLTPIFGIDKFVFTKFVQFLPAIWGALIAITVFFIGKQVTNDNRIGYVTAFIAAVCPAFVYRTFAGAQGDNSFGFLPFSIGLLFFIMAIKEKSITKKSLAYGLISGAAFFVMVFAWNMFPLIFIVLVPTILYTIFYKINEGEELLPYIINAGIPFSIYVAATLINGVNIIELVTGLAGVSPAYLYAALTISVCAIAFFYIYVRKMKKTLPISTKSMCTIIFLVIIVFMLVLFTNIPDLVDRTTVGSMVGEESIGNQFFFSKYNFFLFMPFIALILFPLVIYFKKEVLENPNLMMFFMILFTTFIMAWYKLKFTFTLGYGMIFALGLIAIFLLTIIKNNGFEQKIIAGVSLAILIMYIFAGGIFIVDYTPHVDTQPDYIEMIDWIKNNTPEDAKLMNDWGSGHILSYETGRKVSSDNRNYSMLANALYGEFMVTEDINRGYEIASKEIGTDYIILKLNDIHSLPSQTYYMNNIIDYKLIQHYYVGMNNFVGCVESNNDYICGNNSLPKETFLNFPTSHGEVVYDFYNGRDPMYVYRFKHILVILNKPVNSSNFAHVFFESEKTKDMYKLVFDSSSYRIFEVLK